MTLISKNNGIISLEFLVLKHRFSTFFLERPFTLWCISTSLTHRLVLLVKGFTTHPFSWESTQYGQSYECSKVERPCKQGLCERSEAHNRLSLVTDAIASTFEEERFVLESVQ